MAWPEVPDPDFLPAPESEYWNEQQETRPPEERREAVLEQVARQVRYAYDNSAFYREFYADAPVDPRDISSFEEFEQLPVLRSADLKREQAAHPPFGRFLCVDETEVARVYGTSGTTGRPKVFGISQADWARVGHWHAQILWSAGVRPTDCVIITSPFIQYLGSWGALAGVDRLGCKVFPFGAGIEGQTEQAVEWIDTLQPDALYATPSYALYLGETAVDRGYDPATDFSFRLMFFSGEPGASVPATRETIESTFDCKVVDQGTMAEMTPWMSNSGCRHLDNGMHVWTDMVHTELLDPDTEDSLGFGEEGVPVYTHLGRDSQPLVRYWSGDITTWVSHDAVDCDCGRTYPVLPKGLYGRADDMFTVRGKNVFPSQVEDQLHSLDDFGDEFRIVVDREGALDTLQLVVELADGADTTDNDFAETVRRAVKSDLGVTPEVTVVGQGELERTQFKADRVKDSRELSIDI